MEKDHIIILTGASGGIGSNILKNLYKRFKILAIYNKNKPKIVNKNIIYQKIDFEKNFTIKNKYFKNKNIILINTASIKVDKLLINCSLTEWKKTFSINIDAIFRLTKIIIPHMIKNNWGRIINFSSTGGINGDIGTASYSSTKTAIFGLNKVISKEYGKFNITSNILTLGNFNSGMFKKLNKKKQKKLLESVPLKKTGEFKNIINAINLIINSNYINGTEIKIDGGI